MNSLMYFLIALLILFVACGSQTENQEETHQSDFTATEVFARAGLSFFPEGGDLTQSTFSSDLLTTEPISFEDINDEFTNIDDLRWLVDSTGDSQCVLVGETHYYRYIENLKNRILFALNTENYYPLAVYESQYSLTPYINYYLDIEDDSTAEQFFSDELVFHLTYEDEHNRLSHIRRWNIKFPEKRIHIGCSDIEHDYTSTLNRILIPYFQQIDSALDISVPDLTLEEIQQLIPEFRVILEEAAGSGVVGTYPFITNDYIRNVLDNLESTCVAYIDRQSFNQYRQSAIIRNLTSPDFFGEYFESGKVIIFAGFFHTGTHQAFPVEDDSFTEGVYLNSEYEPTQGQTYSLVLMGYAYTFDAMSEIDISTCGHLGTGYRNTITNMGRAFQEEVINYDDRILVRPIDDFDKLLLFSASESDFHPVRITEFDFEGIVQAAEQISSQYVMQLRSRMDWSIGNHDACILIPWSPIVTAMIE
ncbi:MAG: hypothetical protein KAS73_08075 [Candidatus Sabulitectum sp.]|nr:hypothetical protein [Candidatus Sabulitectum sp.]